MPWDRSKSKLELLLVQALRNADEPLTLNEIVKEIQVIDSSAFTGKSPKNSLYSIIYRREKRRAEKGTPPLLIKEQIGRVTLYTLNVTDNSNIGIQID